MKNVVIAGAFLLVSACGLFSGTAHAQVNNVEPSVVIDSFTVSHENTVVIGGIPYDPEVDGADGDGAAFATRKDKLVYKARLLNPSNWAGYTGKYQINGPGSTSPLAGGSLDVDSFTRFDHKGKKGTAQYSFIVWHEHTANGSTISSSIVQNNVSCN